MNTPSPEGEGFGEPLEVGAFRLKPAEGSPLKQAKAERFDRPLRAPSAPAARRQTRKPRSSQNRLAVLRRARKAEVDLVGAMCPMPVAHADILLRTMLKLSPEGEGFNPPKVGQ